MSGAATLEEPVADETGVRERRYVLAMIRARWGLLAFGVALLAVVRLVGLVSLPWLFIAGFGVGCAGLNYATYRIARRTPFRPRHVSLNTAVGAGVISALLFALGPTGHVLYVAYIITPLQAALYLGRAEAWQALALNLTGFGLVAAIRSVGGEWSWSVVAEESLLLAFAGAALIPMLARIQDRLRATRETLGQVERGDLTALVRDRESDELGFLGVSVNRTTATVADVVRRVQRQAQELAAMAQQVAASAEQLHAASQEISATAQQFSEGAERQRQLIGRGREDSEAAATVASRLHDRAQDSYKHAIDANENDPQALNNLGYSLYLSGNYRAAVDRLKRAARLAPSDARILNNLALAQVRLGKYDDAYRNFARADGEFNGHTNVAALLIRLGRDDKAIQHLEAARRIQPDSQNVLRQLAELYERGGDREKADAARQALQAADAKQALASTEER